MPAGGLRRGPRSAGGSLVMRLLVVLGYLATILSGAAILAYGTPGVDSQGQLGIGLLLAVVGVVVAAGFRSTDELLAGPSRTVRELVAELAAQEEARSNPKHARSERVGTRAR